MPVDVFSQNEGVGEEVHAIQVRGPSQSLYAARGSDATCRTTCTAMREFVTFIGLQYPQSLARFTSLPDQLGPHPSPCVLKKCPSRCPPGQRCAVLNWLRQVQLLAGLVGRVAVRETSVHFYTTCLRAEAAEPLDRAAASALAAPVVIHGAHDAQLLEAVSEMRTAARRGPPPYPKHLLAWRGSFMLNLLKWQIVNATWAELAVFLDLDMEPFPTVGIPHEPWKQATAIEHWLSLLKCVQVSNCPCVAVGALPSPAGTERTRSHRPAGSEWFPLQPHRPLGARQHCLPHRQAQCLSVRRRDSSAA